jgi:hypothetical protein
MAYFPKRFGASGDLFSLGFGLLSCGGAAGSIGIPGGNWLNPPDCFSSAVGSLRAGSGAFSTGLAFSQELP